MTAAFPLLERTADDDPRFVDCVDRVVSGLGFRYRPQVVCIIRVRRWFGDRWLRFSGKGRVPFDSPSPSHVGVALDEFHHEKLTFPPFAPTRVAAEHHWRRTAEGDYVRDNGRFRVHRARRQHSSANLQRRVLDLTDSALFVWFSSTSSSDQRGSMLVYIVNDGATIPWFAAMSSSGEHWSLAEVKGMGRAEVVELLEHPPGVRRSAGSTPIWCGSMMSSRCDKVRSRGKDQDQDEGEGDGEAEAAVGQEVDGEAVRHVDNGQGAPEASSCCTAEARDVGERGALEGVLRRS